MQKQLARWASSLLTVAGLVLVLAFFTSWIRGGVSGFYLAREVKHWLFLVPAVGALLAAAAATRSSYTRVVAVIAGLLVAGDVVYQLLDSVLHSGVDTWLILGGGAVVLAGIEPKHKTLRAVGGFAVLAGFVAPWDKASMLHVLLSSDADMAKAVGINMNVMWLTGAAGIAAITSALIAPAWSRKLAAAAGIAVFVSFFWLLASVANVVFAWGAWTTLGASATALALGILAPNERPAAAAPKA